MSNTYKVIIAALAIAVLGATSIFIIGQNRAENKGINTQISSAISSVKSKVVSSSSQSQILSSSSILAQNSAATSIKTESQIVVSNTTKCNLPESENLVKTEDGCFNLFYSYFDSEVFKDNSIPENSPFNENKLFNNEYSKNIVNKIAIDFYIKNKSSVKTNNYYIRSGINSKKLNNTFILSMYLFETPDENSNNIISTKNYKIFSTLDGWDYQITN